ncbi:ABC transporter substrate-binding protein [Neobacillus drentensis]|uniref:ABC transporter substrate-binding protein n=1 Tax=Bacillaceae TaxID=186817 RepID=UPI0030007227
MSKRFRVLAVFLLTFLVLSTALAGCSKSKESSGSSSNSKDGKPYNVVMAYQSFGNVEDLKMVQDKINKIAKKKINATVTLVPINYGAWNQQSNLMLTGNEKLDLLFTGPDFATKAVKGQIMPLDDLLKSHGKGILKAVPSEILEAAKVDGKVYGVPSMKEWSQQYGFLMTKDFVDKYHINLSNVKTLEDLEEVFKVIKKNEPTVTPIVGGIGGTLPILAYTYSYFDKLGGTVGALDMTKGDFKVINEYEHPAYEAGAKLMRKWYLAGYISKDAATSTDLPSDAMKAGTGFGFFNGLAPGTEVGASNGIGGKPVVAVRFKDIVQFTDSPQILMTLAKNSQNPEKAIEFLNLMYTDKDIMNLLTLGIEGKHYEVNEKGFVTLPKGKTETGYVGNNWVMGNNFLTKVWDGLPANHWDQVKAFNESGKRSPAFGFMFNPDPVKTEIAAVSNVVQQYEKGIGTGTLDPEKMLPEFRKKLKAAGADKIIKEKQKQLDEWRKNK